jgi:hypothetical protein
METHGRGRMDVVNMVAVESSGCGRTEQVCEATREYTIPLKVEVITEETCAFTHEYISLIG